MRCFHITIMLLFLFVFSLLGDRHLCVMFILAEKERYRHVYWKALMDGANHSIIVAPLIDRSVIIQGTRHGAV